MSNDILEIIKKEYENKLQLKKSHNEIVRRIKELQEKKDVLEYLKITNSMTDIEKYKFDNASDEDILYDVFVKNIAIIHDDGDTNDMYVFMRTDIENRNIVNIYWNIEMLYPISILVEDAEEFEKKHTIIRNTFGALSVKELVEMKKTFITKAIASNQDKARKLVLRRYNNIR